MNRVMRTAVVAIVMLIGCADDGTKTQLGESSLEDGIRAFEAQDYEAAVGYLSEALNNGALNVDLMCDARLKRAQARIELDEWDEASEDLEFLMEGAPDTAEVLATMGQLARKQGQLDQAKQHYREARKMNPRIVVPQELR